jgi:hypothetical protein
MVGDNRFWEDLRSYTSVQWGQAVTSEDFQNAFGGINTSVNQNSGKKGRGAARKNSPTTLDDLFDLWVYGVPSGKAK